jgi:voltage-gated potassium channel
MDDARTVTRLARPDSRRRRGFLVRKARATWRDTQALLREFRTPILGFLLVTVVGGFAYGELYHMARGEFIALIDRPYIMLQLMVLESPHDVPPEWFLVAFWYAMPPTFIFLVGLGSADFMHLFFHRRGRRDAWGAAVASTLKNHVIVMGAGHVGLRVIRELVGLGYEVVAIDGSPDPGVDEELERLHVPLIREDGRVAATLERAGLASAEAFVACTGDDHVNMEAILKARDRSPDIRIVARMWDRRFAGQLQRFLNVDQVLSSSDLSAPAFAGAAVGIEITQGLMVNGDEYSMVRMTVGRRSSLAGRTVGQLQAEGSMDVVLHQRGEQVGVQPSRELAVEVGDTLVVFARHDRILEVVAANRNRAVG